MGEQPRTPEGRCGFVVELEDAEQRRDEEIDMEPEEFLRETNAASCCRPVWETPEVDTDLCIWHTEAEDKPIGELRATKGDGSHCLDGAFLVAVDIDDRIDFNECRLQNALFAQCDLEDITFIDSNLYKATFTDSNLYKATFTDSLLYEATFTDSDLTHATFTDSDLTHATFTDSDLRNVTFDSDVPGATVTDNRLWSATFTDSDLRGATFIDGSLYDATFTDNKLWDTTFTDSSLYEATFTDSDLRGATFTDNCDFSDATFITCFIKNVDFDGSRYQEAEFLRNRPSKNEDADRFRDTFRNVWEKADHAVLGSFVGGIVGRATKRGGETILTVAGEGLDKGKSSVFVSGVAQNHSPSTVKEAVITVTFLDRRGNFQAKGQYTIANLPGGEAERFEVENSRNRSKIATYRIEVEDIS